MKKKVLRIPAFDEWIKKHSIECYGESMVVCKCNPDGDRSEKLNPDHIDKFLNEWLISKFHLALQFVYVIPSAGVDIAIPITNRDTFSWSTESTDDGKIYIKLRFKMTDEEFGEQIAGIRNAGITTNFIKLGDTDVIDFGDVNPECIIKCIIDPEFAWNLRSEKVTIGYRDPAIANESGYLISLAMEKYPDYKNERGYTKAQAGMVCLSFATGMRLFTDEQIVSAPKYGEVLDSGTISIHADEDCALPEMPDDYDPVNATDEEDNSEVAQKYKKELKDVMNRRKVWSAIFASPNAFIKESIDSWITTLNPPENTTHLQVHLKELEEWLTNNHMHEKFYEILKAEMASSVQEKIQKQNDIDLANLKISEGNIKDYKELVNLAKAFTEKSNKIAAEMKIEQKAVITDIEYINRINQLEEVRKYEALGTILATSIAIENGLLKDGDKVLTKDDLKDKQVEDFPIIKYILIHFAEIMDPYV